MLFGIDYDCSALVSAAFVLRFSSSLLGPPLSPDNDNDMQLSFMNACVTY